MIDNWGKPKQNWSKLPHVFIENMPLFKSKSEICVVLYVLRHTWGYGDDYKRISLEEFQNGRKRKDGTRIDNGTGMSINAIKSGIKQAIEHGFLCAVRDESDKARIKQYYSLSELDYQKLIPRVSKVDTQPSEVDTRTKKETIRKKLLDEKDIDAIASFSPPPPNSNGSQNPHRKQTSAHQQLMKSYQDALGYKIPHGAKEGKAAKQILQEGYTTEQVIGCYQKMKSDKFWKIKHLSLVSVYEQLGQYCLNGNGHLATMSDDEIAAENERMNAHLPPLGD